MRLRRVKDRHGNSVYTRADYFHYEDLDDLFRTTTFVHNLCTASEEDGGAGPGDLRGRDRGLAGEARDLAELALKTQAASKKIAQTFPAARRRAALKELFSQTYGRAGAVTPFQKTYRDRAGGFLNIKGWLSALANITDSFSAVLGQATPGGRLLWRPWRRV
jgi:hypothetical protein